MRNFFPLLKSSEVLVKMSQINSSEEMTWNISKGSDRYSFLCKHLCRLHLCYKTSLLFNCRNRNIRFSCKTFPKKRFFFHHVAIHRKRLSGIQNFFTRPDQHFFTQCEDLTRISSDRTRCLWSSLHERHFSPLAALDIRKKLCQNL